MPPSRKTRRVRRNTTPRETWICLLRAINVLGRGKVPMQDLRELCAELGAIDPQTYIQSGNVVFDAAGLRESAFCDALESLLMARYEVKTAVILRTPAELQELVACNPFPAEATEAPSKLAVTFLREIPAEAAIEAIPHEGPTGERLRLVGKHLITYFPLGMGQSKLNFAAIERALATPGTARNWNTVVKLLEMAEARTPAQSPQWR
jgi:uncharacterized protein (DUF1697 family)